MLACLSHQKHILNQDMYRYMHAQVRLILKELMFYIVRDIKLCTGKYL